MSIDYLSIRDLRNISVLDIQPSPGLNVIHGANGSGKTSLLEAIYLLGRGKSFRSALSRSIIKKGSDSLLVFGRLQSNNIQTHKLGIQISNNGFKAKLDGQNLQKSSDLAYYLPLLYISPDADKLINSSPRQRRRFIDWGLFHVEPTFLPTWQNYNKVVLQRNALLKKGAYNQLSVWDEQWIDTARALNTLRETYVSHLSSLVAELLQKLSDMSIPTISYKPGWPRDKDLYTALTESADSDKRAGFTQRGPHRADLDIKYEGREAATYLSGGQQKMLAIALLLAQTTLLNSKLDTNCLLLVDDVAAELDSNHRNKFLDLLVETGSQIFVTTTDPNELLLRNYEGYEMFHVEHGFIAQN